jgi:hypothetical protein
MGNLNKTGSTQLPEGLSRSHRGAPGPFTRNERFHITLVVVVPTVVGVARLY